MPVCFEENIWRIRTLKYMMKMKLKYICLIVAVFCVSVSCDKVPMNGDLDGMWQLMTIKKNNDVENVKSYKRYMSFQLRLVQLGSIKDPYCFYGYFKHTSDSLFIYKLTYNSQNATLEDNNEWVTESDKDKLLPWGLYSLNNRFKVVKLDSDAMVLRREDLELTYRKF